jgi:hypothetical protein
MFKYPVNNIISIYEATMVPKEGKFTAKILNNTDPVPNY